MRHDDGQGTSGDRFTSALSQASTTDRVRALVDARTVVAPEPADARFASSPVQVHVVLVGPMGSGKSTVGAQLGGLLGLTALDTDQLFEEVHGPIPAFFAAHGEPAFRAAESEIVLAALSVARPTVLSLGGGAVISATTRQALQKGPAVCHLDVDEAAALARLGGGEGRPVLAGDPARTWRRILSEREHLYREVASWTVKTTGLDAGQVAGTITDLLIEQQADSVDAATGQHHATENHTGDARR